MTRQLDLLLRAFGTRVAALAELAASETQLAATSALAILLLIVVAASSLVVAWGLVVVSALFFIASFGVPWVVAALAIAGVHGLIAIVAWHFTKRLSRNLTLPMLRESLAGDEPAEDAEEER